MSKKSTGQIAPVGGQLQGEHTEALPDRGATRGYTGAKVHNPDGRDLHPDATNRIGGFRATSDEAHRHMPKPPPKGRA